MGVGFRLISVGVGVASKPCIGEAMLDRSPSVEQKISCLDASFHLLQEDLQSHAQRLGV